MINKIGYSREKGQIILVLILIATIGLTIGLSLISRTITDVKISSQIEESSKAYSAAEAGIETALRAGLIAPTGQKDFTLPGSEVSYQIHEYGNENAMVEYSSTDAGNNQVLWFINHNSDGSPNLSDPNAFPLKQPLDICWANDAALMLTLFYKDGVNDPEIKFAKRAFENPSRFTLPRSINIDFNSALNDNCGGDYVYKLTVNYEDGLHLSQFWSGLILPNQAELLSLNIQPLFSPSPIGVKVQNAASLPPQGKQIISMGKTQTGVIKKIEVKQSTEMIPGIFTFTFFSD